MEPIVGRYWLFAVICLGLAGAILRLIAREHLTIQTSLFYVLGLLALAAMALFPNGAAFIAQRMGFALISNWFFAVAIAVLSFLHLTALISLSRVETRSIALTQELGILRERLERALAQEQLPSPRS
jgi:hypothetical protein